MTFTDEEDEKIQSILYNIKYDSDKLKALCDHFKLDFNNILEWDVYAECHSWEDVSKYLKNEVRKQKLNDIL